jgi:hypothetical protein
MSVAVKKGWTSRRYNWIPPPLDERLKPRPPTAPCPSPQEADPNRRRYPPSARNRWTLRRRLGKSFPFRDVSAASCARHVASIRASATLTARDSPHELRSSPHSGARSLTRMESPVYRVRMQASNQPHLAAPFCAVRRDGRTMPCSSAATPVEVV